MSIHLILTLVTLLVVVIMFLSGKFNFGWIGMFCATFLCATGALGKTTLVDHVRNWIMSKGTSGRSIVFLYLLGSILLTQLVSPLGVIAMLLPLTAALDENSPCSLPSFCTPALSAPTLLRRCCRSAPA